MARPAPRGLRGHGAALLRGRAVHGRAQGLRLARPRVVRDELPGLSNGRWLLAAAVLVLATNVFNLLDLRPGRSIEGLRAARRRRSTLGSGTTAPAVGARPVRRARARRRRSMTCASAAMLGDTGANLLGALAGLWLVLTLSGTGQLVALAAARRHHPLRRASIDFRAHRTDSRAARTRLLGQALMTLHQADRHAQPPGQDPVHLRDRRRRLLARQGHRRLVDRTSARLARADRRAAEVRPLHQRRPGHDVALPARRGVRHRGRRRDRPRSRPLRALHRRQHQPRLERHRRRDLRHRDPPRAPRRLPRRRPSRSCRTSPTRSSSGSR